MHNVLAFCVPMTCLPLQNMILQNCCHIKFYNIKMIFVIQVCALILCRLCMPKFMHECDPKVDSYIQDWLDMCVNFFILCYPMLDFLGCISDKTDAQALHCRSGSSFAWYGFVFLAWVSFNYELDQELSFRS